MGEPKDRRTSGSRSVRQRGVDFVFAAAAIVLLWLLLLVALMLLVSVVAPGSDTVAFFASAGFALLVAFGLAGAGIGALRWAKDIPDERVMTAGTHDDRLSPLIRDFRVRSRIYRIAAAGLFALLAFVTVAGFFMVRTPARERSDYHDALPGQLDHCSRLSRHQRWATLRDPDVRKRRPRIIPDERRSGRWCCPGDRFHATI